MVLAQIHSTWRQGAKKGLLCRVAVLEGGLPLWISAGYELDEAPASDHELEAPLSATQHPPPHLHYRARLQASSKAFTGMMCGCLWMQNPI